MWLLCTVFDEASVAALTEHFIFPSVRGIRAFATASLVGKLKHHSMRLSTTAPFYDTVLARSSETDKLFHFILSFNACQ
jgi:hypothetical protein